MTTKQTGGPAYPCKITTDVEALKQQQPRQNHITAEERIEASFINGWNECLDMLASRNLLRQDSVADMMEALPIGFSIYHANNGKWVISDVLNNMIYAEGDLPEALCAALEKIGEQHLKGEG